MKKQVTVICFLIIGAMTVAGCPCPAGTHCLPVTVSPDCRPCKEKKYQDEPNTTAFSCSDCAVDCQQKEFVVSECSRTHNLICQCEDGYYKAPGPKGPCLPHNACKAGFEEKAPGTPFNDIVCEKCKRGKFRPAESESKNCIPCKVCTKHEEVGIACTASKNTECRQKGDNTVAIGLGVTGAVLIIVIVVVLVCMHRRGYDLRFWKRFTDNPDEKQPPSENHHLTSNGATDSPSYAVKMPKNGTSNKTSSRSNGHIRDNLTTEAKRAPVSLDMASEEAESTSRNRHTSQTQERDYLNIFFMSLSADLCSIPEWKMFMRALIGEGSDAIIGMAVANNPNNAQEQIYQVFVKWRQNNPHEATKGRVIQELKSNDLNLYAHKYEESSVTEV